MSDQQCSCTQQESGKRFLIFLSRREKFLVIQVWVLHRNVCETNYRSVYLLYELEIDLPCKAILVLVVHLLSLSAILDSLLFQEF